jgi:hypothetical protein
VGASPSDLDSHLTVPNADVSRFHVFYQNRGAFDAPPFAGLDVDDVASFGPETITITQLNSGSYRYSVHDFTNRSSAASTALGNSGARVEVYFNGGLQRTFFVPPGQAGNLWTVFELTGTDVLNPTITERKGMGFVEDPGTVPIVQPKARVAGATDAAVIGKAARAQPKVKAR